jgi:hypothetical protein
MTDHHDPTWSIARLLYATQLPLLLLAWVVFAVAVVVLTVGIDVFGTVDRSVWDPAVTIVRWFACRSGWRPSGCSTRPPSTRGSS